MGRDKRLEGAAVALASLPDMGPRRLRAIVHRWGVVKGWEAVVAGEVASDRTVAATMGKKPAELAQTWASQARDIDPAELLAEHAEQGIDVLVYGGDRFPAVLAADVEPPTVLFARGDLHSLDGPRVGIVGTRRATSGGRQTAAEMGRELARAGVHVVSGLALGIDGAAHQGALRAATSGAGPAAPVVGVVGTGLDVVYPARHRDLWRAVGRDGLLLTEVPLGGPPAQWRFPARNRLIAALSDVLVVVESHPRGGALHTVEEAQRRDVPIMVVPGSVRVAACAGTNQLLVDGATPALSADDVLAALDLSACSRLPFDDPTGPAPDPADDRPTAPALDPADLALLEHLGGEPVALDLLAVRAGVDLGELSLRLARLEIAGRIVRHGSAIEEVRPR